MRGAVMARLRAEFLIAKERDDKQDASKQQKQKPERGNENLQSSWQSSLAGNGGREEGSSGKGSIGSPRNLLMEIRDFVGARLFFFSPVGWREGGGNGGAH